MYAPLSVLDPAADHHQPTPPLETPEGHKQNLVCTRIQEKGGVTPQQTDPDLPVSGSLQQRCGSAVACFRVRGTEYRSVCMGPFEGDRHYLPYFHHPLDSDQATRREDSPDHQQKIGLKVY